MTIAQMRARLAHARSKQRFHKARVKFWARQAATWTKRITQASTPQVWYPAARKLPRTDAGAFVTGKPKGVLHTTEGAGDATATLDANRSWPHFQVERSGRVTQYLPLNRSGRALEHRSGTVETNRAHAIQIEVCGFASQPDWPGVQVTALRKVMRFIEANAGVGRFSSVKFVVGTNHFTDARWLAYNGWCGHQHVPNNSHTDPGAIDVQKLL